MITLLVRGLLARKLRTTLTALAVLLGVAMIAGTYVLTGGITATFTRTIEDSGKGVDVAVTPKLRFEQSTGASTATLPLRLVAQVQAVPGVALAVPFLQTSGSPVVHGRVIAPAGGAPAIVVSARPPGVTRQPLAAGHLPRGPGDVAINQKVVVDAHLALGDRLGLTTAHGVAPVRLVGILRPGGSASVAGSTLVIATFADAAAWYDLRGRASEIDVQARPGVNGSTLASRVRAAMPTTAQVRTGDELVHDQLASMHRAIDTFLTPVLVGFGGAAVLVAAFIIFNTFSVTVAQRVRELGLLRTLGATRRQVLGEVIAEAVIVGVLASIAGLGVGLGIARLLVRALASAGFDASSSGLSLTPRVALMAAAVGIGVTVAAAIVPALRATRVPPVAAMRRGVPLGRGRFSRSTPAIALLAGGVGLVLLVRGALGSGPAVARLQVMAVGAVLAFVAVATASRYVVRPLAAAIGWPLERLGGASGRLARENAARNPARTAVTAAALMVGIGLVAFVAVLAQGLRVSFHESLDRLFAADVVVAPATQWEMVPAAAAVAAQSVPGAVAAPLWFDQVEVAGSGGSSVLTDLVVGVEPSKLRAVYRVDWLHGNDRTLAGLGGNRIVVEEQFAKAHGLHVGGTVRLATPAGRSTTLRIIGEYRDPLLIQGSMVARSTFDRLSTRHDVSGVYLRARPGVAASAVEASTLRALRGFPGLKIQSNAAFRAALDAQLDRLVYLLDALLAMSFVVSILGIVNTLTLAVQERTGEIGMLRAVGATRGQIRQMIRLESVITAVIGGALGIAIGTAFAWIVTRGLADLGIGFRLPVAQLAVFVGVAVLVGLVAAAAPARRAARLRIVEALGVE